jgi:hypothetical protein
VLPRDPAKARKIWFIAMAWLLLAGVLPFPIATAVIASYLILGKVFHIKYWWVPWAILGGLYAGSLLIARIAR